MTSLRELNLFELNGVLRDIGLKHKNVLSSQFTLD